MQRLLIAVPLALALLLGGPAVRLDRPCLAAELTLEDLIELVRQNELLYEDIDVVLRDSFRDQADHTGQGPGKSHDGKWSFTTIITRDDTVAHYVAQGGRFRYQEDNNSTYLDGSEHTLHHTSAFDGGTTRLLTGSIANIIGAYKPTGLPIRPHTLLLRMIGRAEQLSAFLGGDAMIKRDPYGYTDNETRRQTEYVGPAEYRGLRCHIVRSTVHVLKTGAQANHSDLWLAEDRNYIPVRMFGYEHDISSSESVGEAEVVEWTEVKPGIWFPARVIGSCIDQRTARLTGRRVPGWRREYTIERVSLEPQYRAQFFEEFSIPAGTIVYEYEGDRLVRSYQQGAPPAPREKADGKAGRTYLIWLGTLLVPAAAFVLYLTRKHRRRVHTVPAPPQP